MKLQIKKNELANIIKIASNVITSNNLNPVLDALLIDANSETNEITFIFLNDILKIKCKVTENINVETSGKTLIKFKSLESIINKMPNEMISLERIDSNSLRITKQNFEANINILDDSLFIQIDFTVDPSWETFSLSKNTINNIEKKLFHCCLPKIEKLSPLNGILLDSEVFDNHIYISTTDGFKAAMINEEFNGSKFKIILDQDIIKFINNYLVNTKDIKFHITQNNLFVVTDNITVISKNIIGAYPNIYSVFDIPNENISFKVKSGDFYEIVERGNFIVSSDKNPIVQVKMENQKLEISFKSTEVGNSFEYLELLENQNQHFVSTLNSKYLLSILKAFENHEIMFIYTNPNKQIIIKDLNDTSFKQLVLPLRS